MFFASFAPMTEIKDLLAQPGYECQLLLDRISREELRELDPELPSDTYFVRYAKDGNEFASAFRAYKSSDIFDPLFDAGYEVLEIAYGFGRIRPNLYGFRAPADSKKKGG